MTTPQLFQQPPIDPIVAHYFTKWGATDLTTYIKSLLATKNIMNGQTMTIHEQRILCALWDEHNYQRPRTTIVMDLHPSMPLDQYEIDLVLVLTEQSATRRATVMIPVEVGGSALRTNPMKSRALIRKGMTAPYLIPNDYLSTLPQVEQAGKDLYDTATASME